MIYGNMEGKWSSLTSGQDLFGKGQRKAKVVLMNANIVLNYDTKVKKVTMACMCNRN